MNAQKPKGAPVKVQVSVLASSEPAKALRQAKKSVGEEKLQAFSYNGLCIYIDDLKQLLLSNLNPDNREWHELDNKLRSALSEKRKREEQQDSRIRCDGGTPTKLLTAFGKPAKAQESLNESQILADILNWVDSHDDIVLPEFYDDNSGFFYIRTAGCSCCASILENKLTDEYGYDDDIDDAYKRILSKKGIQLTIVKRILNRYLQRNKLPFELVETRNDGGTPTFRDRLILAEHENLKRIPQLPAPKQDTDSYAEIETDNGKLRIYPDRIELYKSSQDFPKGIHETSYQFVKTEFRFLELKDKLKRYVNGDKSINGMPTGLFAFAVKQNFIFSVRNNGYRVWYPHSWVFEHTPAEEQHLLDDWNKQPRATKVWKKNGEVVYSKEWVNGKWKYTPITYTTAPIKVSNIPDIATVSKNIRRRAERKEKNIIAWQQRVLKAWKYHKVVYSKTKKKYIVEFQNGELREYEPRALQFIPALKKSHEEWQKHHRKSKMIPAESTVNGVKLTYKINPNIWQPTTADTISGLKYRYYCYVCQKTIPKKQTKLSKEDKEIVICGKKTTVKVPVRLCPAGHKCTRATEEELFLNQFTTKDEEEYKARRNAHYTVNDEYNPNDENSQRYTELSTKEQGEKVNDC